MTARKIMVNGQLLNVSGSGYAPTGVYSLDGEEIAPTAPLRRLLEAATLASDARLVPGEIADTWDIVGDPTEGALVVAAAKIGIEKATLDESLPRVHEIPFTSETKRMTTLHEGDGEKLTCCKGAPEIILQSCSRLLTLDGEIPLESSGKEQILLCAKELASQALRVLAVASKAGADPDSAESDMTFLGLVGMIDPPRPEARQAVATCKDAGIRVVMITGDHPITAQAIAEELGILTDGRVVTGHDVEAMTDTQLEEEAEKIEVYARVSPAHKLRVVTALQKRGHIAAMTGDGVNDAPALKKADIGIAMGITGTDVTREASAMTLTDDNFASIVAAVEEGRGLFSNIKKYLMYLLSANVGEIGLMSATALFGMPMPLSAVQILYVNLATDGLPALALAVDPPEKDLMQRRPRNPRKGIFTRPVLLLMLAGGFWLAAVNFGLFAWALQSGRSLEQAMAMVFVTLVLMEFCKAYNFRSDRHSVLRSPFKNKWLNLAILWEILLLVAVVYVPFLQNAFNIFALSLHDWIIAICLALTVLPVMELLKWIVRRRFLKSSETE
jgi:Ca2+-transporting ATPase